MGKFETEFEPKLKNKKSRRAWRASRVELEVFDTFEDDWDLWILKEVPYWQEKQTSGKEL